MITDLTKLVHRFVQLNRDITHGYVDLSEYLDTYTAMDLLTHREFQPILAALSAIGVDLFFTLSVIVGLYRRLDKPAFASLSGHLDLVANRIIIRSPADPEVTKEYQSCADRLATRSIEIGSYYYHEDRSVTDFAIN